MNIEVEYKFKLTESADKILSKLTELGYTISKRNYEKTVMYDNKAELMQVTDGRIRLRQSGDKYSLSYKKPLPAEPGKPKREIEYETSVGNFETIAKILETMEFSPSSSYEKYRTKAEKDGVQVTIDEYSYQTFIEIEGSEEKIARVAELLNLNVKDHINLPADTLFNIWRKERGLPESMHMRFDGYDK